MEISPSVYQRITALSEQGNVLMEEEAFTEARAKFQQAIELLPPPAMQWEAATWLYGSLGESKFLQFDFPDAEEDFGIAIQCPGGNENPFIHLRLDECLLTRNEPDQAAHHLTVTFYGWHHPARGVIALPQWS
ncbi:tetratricopeptide repeat protein [Rhodopirellula sp. MGV]|uniref:tetratricopeptide repeat protein n=1 Tax=Rhodopirellula sp. MGV TaxID=2023130 RepID=UPI000B967767|nr:tetratricopeptide repeat protein [Rhodopirellula sp. MGV]PNY37296.1 tetratricopeptide repeat-containing protein [Rhodopirellula baltica]